MNSGHSLSGGLPAKSAGALSPTSLAVPETMTLSPTFPPILDRNISSKAVVGEDSSALLVPLSAFTPLEEINEPTGKPHALHPNPSLHHFSAAATHDRQVSATGSSHHTSSKDCSECGSRAHSSSSRHHAVHPPGPARLILPARLTESTFNLSATAGWVQNVEPFSTLDAAESDSEDELVHESSVGNESAYTGSRKSKGTGTGTDLETLDGRPLIPLVLTPDASVSQQASSSYVSVEKRQPIRIRRVGALGISVSSESGDGSRALRDRDMDSAETDDKDSRGGSAEALRVAPSGVNNFDFRGIVDELSLQNQILKSRLKRYEAARVPVELKKERLFEVRFFDGLPSDKREELQAFLTSYVQGLSGTVPLPSAASFPFPPTPIVAPQPGTTAEVSVDIPMRAPSPPNIPSAAALPTPLFSPKPSKEAKPLVIAMPAAFEPQYRPSVAALARLNSASAPPAPLPSTSNFVSRASSPPSSSRRKHQRRKGGDREYLAAPSYSGLEPASLSGTGTGMKLSPSSADGRTRRIAVDISPPKSIRGGQTDETKCAVEIVEVLERLFFDSLHGADARPETTSRGMGTNESYLGRLLSNDEISDGWTYLRLVCTFGNIHRFSVTLSFVQSAIRGFSTRLEISLDGSLIRWIGTRPSIIDSISAKVTRRKDSAVGSEEITSTTESDVVSGVGAPVTRSLTDSLPQASTAATSIAMTKSPGTTRQLRSGRTQDTTSPMLKPSLPPPRPSPFAVALSRQTTKSSYVPMFDRRDEEVRSEESTEDVEPLSLGVQGVPGQGEPSARRRHEGAGQTVYYANPHFCSDLSTDVVAAVEYKELEEETVMRVLSEESSPPGAPASADGSDADDLVIHEGAGAPSGHSPYPLLRQLIISGTTEVEAADSFTHLVKTAHPRPLSSGLVATALLARKRKYAVLDSSQMLPPVSKREKLGGMVYAHKIVANRLIHHHVSSVQRRVPMSSYSSSGSSGSASSRGSGKRDHAIPEIVMSDYTEQSPPPPDYLLSLSCPFFAWAPNITGIAALDSFRSSSAMRSSVRLQDGEDYEGGAGGPEGPIDLDEEVPAKLPPALET